ncbi:stalk domain-containing protein [Solibacillus sp. R5-41]|uniref:stalk domain-containing protein n=1 Tax=Solibacillus sp. R5-41 TaxID=2048654 RepID=UPI0012FE0279|nr:stalk domain-containing protein [Solibacillus sp. R5-41]
MKKFLTVLLIILMLSGTSWETASASTTVTLDGGKVVNNRTLVPLRAIFEELGTTVQWNQKDKTITAKKGQTTIWLEVGSKTTKINNKAVTIDVPAQVYNGSTLVPLRFISESFGVKTTWNAKEETAILTADDKTIIVNAGEFDSAFALDTIDIKSSPGEIYDTIGVISDGANVKVVGGVPTGYDQEDWYSYEMYGWSKIQYEGLTGWVATHNLSFQNPYNWVPGIKDNTLNQLKKEFVGKSDKFKLVEAGAFNGVGSLEFYVQYDGVGQWYRVVSINPKTGWYHG